MLGYAVAGAAGDGGGGGIQHLGDTGRTRPLSAARWWTGSPARCPDAASCCSAPGPSGTGRGD